MRRRECCLRNEKTKNVTKIYKETEKEAIAWGPVKFTKEEGDSWRISFKAQWQGMELVLEKRHSIEYGGNVSRDICSLTVSKNGKKEFSAGYSTDEDYVETLGATGVPTLGLLTRHLIDKFRNQLKLHWSVM